MVSDLFLAVGEIPTKFINLPANRFYTRCNDVTQTTAAECKYEFVHTELVQVFYDINGSAHVIFNLKKKQQSILKNRFVYTNKFGMLSVIKQLQHFILCNIMYYGTQKSNIDYS